MLNDAWERSYGDLEWQTLGKNTIYSPWYFLAEKNGTVQGFGVETGPASMCCWEVATNGVTLVLDVRAGGRPVRLNGRTLKACRIVRAESIDGETPWQFGRRFCRMMCPNPKLPKDPVYGYNDWYCAYGKNTATNFLADAEYVVACAKGCENPPYVVMDDGWQKNSPPVVGESGRGPWDAAGPNFGMEMPEFCRAIVALGAKPGLWYRPLRAWDELPEEQRLVSDRDYLDPTVPSVRSRIVADMKRFREWGFKLVKIDFLSFDISQLWPCDPHPHHDRFIQDDRAWRDDTRTTAEVMLDLYRAMKDAAGDDVVIIGCNALNHLAAGVFELQRTGNDTSGKDWNWTRKNGVNTLAMRSIQDGAFFKIDADCVGLASEGAVPWNLNRQWMELLGRSGTPFFVSWKRELATPEVRAALADAFKCASSDRETAEPVDWIKTRQPRRWHLADGTAEYDWLAFCDCALGSEYGRPTGELQEKAQALADLAVKEGMQGALQFCAFKDGKCIVDVWARPLADGNAAVALVNHYPFAREVRVEFSELGLGGEMWVKDLWRHTCEGRHYGAYAAVVPPHATTLLKVCKVPCPRCD